MTLGNGHWVALTAENGTFDRESSELDLTGTVRFFHDDGYQMTTDRASIDFRAGQAQGDRPVTAQGPAGTAVAEGFKVLAQGRTVVFTGTSSMLLNQPVDRKSTRLTS